MRRAAFLLALCMQGVALAAPTYQIVSGDLPPMADERSYEAPGALVEIVKLLAQRTGEAPTVQFYPWARAVLMAQTQARTLILPLTRTPEREARFRWVVKLYHQDFVFTVLKGRGIAPAPVEALRDLRVAVLRGSPTVEQLQARQFTNLVITPHVEDMVRMLKAGSVDAIYGSNVSNSYALKRAGVHAGSFVTGQPVEGGDVWLGASIDFTDTEIAAWQVAMRRLMAEGTYQRILRKYGLKP